MEKELENNKNIKSPNALLPVCLPLAPKIFISPIDAAAPGSSSVNLWFHSWQVARGMKRGFCRIRGLSTQTRCATGSKDATRGSWPYY